MGSDDAERRAAARRRGARQGGRLRGSRWRDRKLATMGRRRFVTTLAKAGFGAMAGLLAPRDVLAAGTDEVPVVYGHAVGDEGREARTRAVPADWFTDLRAALDAHADAALVARDGVGATAVVPGEFGGRNAAIEVAATGDADVPTAVGEVPVEVRQVARAERDPTRAATSATAVDGTAIPGGVPCANQGSGGTLAPAMYDGDTAFFATSNHVYGDDGATHRGEPLFIHASSRTRIGTVSRGYALDDFVRIDPAGRYRPVSRIRDASPAPVVGQFSRTGLAMLKAQDKRIEKVGATTGHTAGRIQAVDGMTCAYGKVCKHGQLKWGDESSFADGDSGSVNYHPDPENPKGGIMIGGFNNARTWWPGENYVWGTAAYRVTARHGFTFTPGAAVSP